MDVTIQYVAPLVLAGLVSAVIAAAAWRRRPAPGALPFAVLMSSVAIWSFGYALELYVPGLAAKILWGKIEYLAIVFVPLTWLVFALEYTGRERWLTRRTIGALAALPLLVLALVWTNEAHRLIWRALQIDSSGAIAVLRVTYGSAFWVHTGYSYLLMLLATGMLVRKITSSSHLYREQAVPLLIGAFAPWLGNALYLIGLGPAVRLDLTPFAFTITGLTFGWSLLRSHLLDIVPVARDAVLERMSDGVIVLNGQNRIVDLNPAARAIVGWNDNRAIGQLAGDAFASWPHLVETYRDVQDARAEITIDSAQGPASYDLRITPIIDRRGGPSGRLIVLRDITERKQAEKVLLRQNEYLVALHDTALGLVNRLDLATVLETIVERASQILGAPNGFLFTYQPDTHTLVAEVGIGRFANSRGYQLKPSECLVGLVWTHGESMTVDDYSTWEHRLSDFAPLELGSVVAIPLHSDTSVIGVLGLAYDQAGHLFTDEELTVLSRLGQLAALAIDNARLFASVQMLYDEQRSLADQLLKAKDLAEAANRAKTEFISFISHELRNPMTSMRGYIDLLKVGAAGPLSADQTEIIDTVRTNIDFMTTLVSDLLDTARIESGRLRLKFTSISLIELLDGVVISAHGQLERKSQMLDLHIQPDLPPVWADEVRVTQILSNLLNNANKYTPNGGSISITASQCNDCGGARPGHEMLHIVVRDTGIGISEAEQPRVFEYFFRSDDPHARAASGTGLGLAITRSLVELMGGQIWFESIYKQGSAFHFTLPIATENQRVDDDRQLLARA